MDGTNPLIFLGLGILAKNPILTGIGLFGMVDPPDTEKKEEYMQCLNVGENEECAEYSNVGENEESAEYSNVGEIEKTEQKKRCVF